MCSPQIGVAAAIIAALPPLGIDVRFFGRPNVPLEGIPYFRARQAQRAIVVALISLGVSVGAFYYFFRPRVVEKIVEKPVEKLVLAPCPEPQVPSAKPIVGNKSPKTSKDANISSPTQAPQTQFCEGGNCAQSSGQTGGITAGQINLPGSPVQLHLASVIDIPPKNDDPADTSTCKYEKQITVTVTGSYTLRSKWGIVRSKSPWTRTDTSFQGRMFLLSTNWMKCPLKQRKQLRTNPHQRRTNTKAS